MPTSETSKYRHITVPYCQGLGVDIGSSGDPVVPHAIQIDLEQPYCPLLGDGPIHIKGDGSKLRWFAHESLDFVYSSHLIEDFNAAQQAAILREWAFPLKPDGFLIILAPEFGRWQRALLNGQPPNDAHKHELLEGELTQRIEVNCPGQFEVIMDRCPDPNDYGLVFIARKKVK